MSTKGTLLLSWNKFEGHASTTIKHLWEDKTFTDVTFTTKDEVEIRVHKAVLCSISLFFKNILMTDVNNNHIILENMEHYNLENILKFAYLGSCELEESELDAFLDTGNYLEVVFFSEDITIASKDQFPNKKQSFEIEYQNLKEKYIFDCDLCDKKYSKKIHLQDHKQSHHIKIKGFECGQCEYKAYRKNGCNKTHAIKASRSCVHV